MLIDNWVESGIVTNDFSSHIREVDRCMVYQILRIFKLRNHYKAGMSVVFF